MFLFLLEIYIFFKDPDLNSFENKFCYMEHLIDIRFESVFMQIDEYFEILTEKIEKLKTKLLRSKYSNSKIRLKLSDKIVIDRNIGKLVHNTKNYLFQFKFYKIDEKQS